jgi:DNA (cytosine-5)-methyltransferase 1
MRYGSVCSGIEAATVAWHPLGWEPAFFSEIEKFPRAVLAHHYPSVPLHGDFTTIKGDEYGPIDLLVGGTPCQSFSVAGLRGGLADDRGNLALEFLRLAQRARPRWLVWENVPGVLSSSGGRDFGSIVGGMAELGYGWAYRVLDAQYFGVPQRRRRVFLVGHLGDWRRAAAVLFERKSMSGDPAPSRAVRERTSTTVTSGPPFSRTGNQRVEVDALILERWPAQVAPTLNAHFGEKQGLENQHALNGAGLFVPVPMINMQGSKGNAVAQEDGPSFTLNAMHGHDVHAVVAPMATTMQARRLTPRECERLQGFPDDYTAIPWRGRPASECPNGPRYRALGNSMAVPVMSWIGRRINAIETKEGP